MPTLFEVERVGSCFVCEPKLDGEAVHAINWFDIKHSTTLTGGEGSTDNLGAVDDRHNLPLHMLPNGLGFVVAVGTLLQDLDAAECRAGQQTFDIVLRII